MVPSPRPFSFEVSTLGLVLDFLPFFLQELLGGDGEIIQRLDQLVAQSDVRQLGNLIDQKSIR
jgi:hypothetical protein